MQCKIEKILLLFSAWTILAISGCIQNRMYGMNINEAFDPSVALLVEAALDGDADQVKTLIKQGTNVNTLGKKKMTPLFWVIADRNKLGMKLLLGAGADPNLKALGGGLSATNYTAGGDDPELLEIVLKSAGNPNIARDSDGATPLQVAVEQKRFDNIKLLIQYDADVNQVGRMNKTAARSAIVSGHPEYALYMLEHGYIHDLNGLGRSVVNRSLGSEEGNQNKQQLIEILQKKGATFSTVPN
jgi:ankyrin repeat protein